MTKLWQRLRELLYRTRLDQDAVDEIALHVEMAVAEKIEAGIDPAEARRQARIELGNPDEAHEQLRERRTGFLLDSVLQDAAYALRVLRKRPGFSAVSILTIALGVASTTALFAVLDAVALKPLPFPAPDRLVRVFDTNPRLGVERTGSASGNVADWRRRARSFEGIAAHYTMGRTLTSDAVSEVVLTAQVSEDFFALLGVPPARGRTFTADETARAHYNTAAAPVGADPVAVLSHGLWRSRFGADPSVVGRTVTLERRAYRVVGVMPPGFAMPQANVQVWVPWDLSGDQPRDQHYLEVMARLKPGVTLPQAAEDLNAIAAVLAVEHPPTNDGWGVQVVSLREVLVGNAGRTLWTLLGAVALLLLVACANVALLSLARGLERFHEVQVRLALGATRGRLRRQFLVESLILAGAGGLLGTLLAALAVALLRWAPLDLPRLHEAALDPRVVLFACCATGAAVLVAGIPYAWRRSRGEAGSGLGDAALPRPAATGGHALGDALVVVEVAVAVVLLAGASLLVRSYQHLRAVDPGFDPQGVLVAPIFLDMEAYGGGGKSRAYYASLFERIEALPGVLSVGGATALPASPLGPDFQRPVWPEEAPQDKRTRREAWVRMVTPHYFRTLGMPFREGRAFEAQDGPDGPRVVILSESLARRLWPEGSAVGQRLVVDYSTSGTYPYTVVGVVNDVHFAGPRTPPRDEIYLAHAQRPYLVLNVAVRATGDPWLLAAAIRGVLHELDPEKPAHGIHTLDDLHRATFARDRQATLILSAFAAAAVFLSLLGVHGILLHRVRERTREIGIRMAIGAGPGRLLSWIAGRGLRLTLAGVALGLPLAALASRALSALLFGVYPTDTATALAVAAFPVVGLVVSLHPAWRASRVDAAEVLRRA